MPTHGSLTKAGKVRDASKLIATPRSKLSPRLSPRTRNRGRYSQCLWRKRTEERIHRPLKRGELHGGH